MIRDDMMGKMEGCERGVSVCSRIISHIECYVEYSVYRVLCVVYVMGRGIWDIMRVDE